MSSLNALTDSQAELLDLLDDVSHGKNEQQRQDALRIIDDMDSSSILELMMLLRLNGKQQLVATRTTGDDIAYKLHLPLEPCHNSAGHVTGTEWISTRRCGSPQQAHAVMDKAVDFHLGKDTQDFATPRLGDLRESDQSPTATIRTAAATHQEPVVSNRLLAQLEAQERSAKELGSLELMGQSLAVGFSTAKLNLLQASHMELVPSSYGEQQADGVDAALHSSHANYSSEPSGKAAAAGTEHKAVTEHARSSSSCSSNSSASFRQFQQFRGSSADARAVQEPAVAHAATAEAHTARSSQEAATMAPGSFASTGYFDSEAPQCISIPYEPALVSRPPVDSNHARGSELRQSALTGPVHSFQLQLHADVEDEDTASEMALSDAVVTPTAYAAAQFAAVKSPAGSSCHTPASMFEKGSALPGFSSSSSPANAPQCRVPAPADKPQQQQASSKPRGLGRVIGAIRRSLTGKQVKDEVAAASLAATAASTRPGSTRSGTPASTAGSRAAVQSRLPSFTETERVRQQMTACSGGSRAAAGKSNTPSSTSGSSKSPYAAAGLGYKPPGSVGSTAPGRKAAGEAAAACQKPPLGIAAALPGSRAACTATAAGPFSRIPSGGGSKTPTAHSPGPYKLSAAQKATAASAAASPTGSAGLAWLKQHSSEHESNAAGLRTAPVSPCTSRPASVASVRSVASAAPHVGAPSRMAAGAAGNAGSGQLPGFKMTKQMVDSKQQPGPPKQQRTPVSTPGNSARSAATKTSKASYVRQLSSPGDALTAAAAAVATAAVSRGGVSKLPGSSGGGAGANIAKQGPRAGQQMHGHTLPALSPCSATTGSTGAARRGFAAATAVGAAASPAAGVSRQIASRIEKGASRLRRSRSCGSLADMLARAGDKTHEVSEVRKMWQQRAAEHRQQQEEKLNPRQQHQQLQASPAVAVAAAGQAVSLSSRAGPTRIPSLGGNRIPSATCAAAAPGAASTPVLHGPELTDSPPLSPVSGEVRLSRSRCGRRSDASGTSDTVLPACAAAATATHAPALGSSFVPGLKMQGLLQRMDDAICDLQPVLPAESHPAALPTLSGAGGTCPSAVGSKFVAGGGDAVAVVSSDHAALHEQLLGEQQAITLLNRQLFS